MPLMTVAICDLCGCREESHHESLLIRSGWVHCIHGMMLCRDCKASPTHRLRADTKSNTSHNDTE